MSRVRTITESLSIAAGATWNSDPFKIEAAPWEDYSLFQFECTASLPVQNFNIWGRPTPTAPWKRIYANSNINSDIGKTRFCPEFYIQIVANASAAVTAGKVYMGR